MTSLPGEIIEQESVDNTPPGTPDSFAVFTGASHRALQILRRCVNIQKGRPIGLPRVRSGDARVIAEELKLLVTEAKKQPLIWAEIERRGKFATETTQLCDPNNPQLRLNATTSSRVSDRPADLLEADCCGCLQLESMSSSSIDELTSLFDPLRPVRIMLNTVYVAIENLLAWTIQNLSASVCDSNSLPPDQPSVRGVSLLDAALAANDGDRAPASVTKKRWLNSRNEKLPASIGFDPDHRQRHLYDFTELLDFIAKVESPAIVSKIRKTLKNSLRAPKTLTPETVRKPSAPSAKSKPSKNDLHTIRSLNTA